MVKIVIVEDELIAAEYLKKLLLSHGFHILAVIDTGKKALETIPKLAPDIVLMDIMLKDNISGSEVALQLKQTAPHVAIVFLTAYAEEEMIEYAIESNTYGYLMKPYDDARISTSLKIILSRIEKDKKQIPKIDSKIYIDSDFTFDLELQRFFKNEVEISLGQKSLALLEALCQHPNSSISSEQLCRKIWGEPKSTSMLRTQVSRTKKEMGINVIENIKGLGYKIVCST